MMENSGKLQYMLLGKRNTLKIEIELFQLESAESVKRLGITIDHDLACGTHETNICKMASAKVKSLSGIRNALDEKQAKLLNNAFILSQFNYCSIVWMFCSKTSYKKIQEIQKGYLRIVFNEPHMSLEELLIHDQGILEHTNTLLTEGYKTFSWENPYFMKSIFTKVDVICSLRTSNLLTLPKINTKSFGLYSFSFCASYLWNQLPDHVKYEVSVKGFENKLVRI